MSMTDENEPILCSAFDPADSAWFGLVRQAVGWAPVVADRFRYRICVTGIEYEGPILNRIPTFAIAMFLYFSIVMPAEELDEQIESIGASHFFPPSKGQPWLYAWVERDS